MGRQVGEGGRKGGAQCVSVCSHGCSQKRLQSALCPVFHSTEKSRQAVKVPIAKKKTKNLSWCSFSCSLVPDTMRAVATSTMIQLY